MATITVSGTGNFKAYIVTLYDFDHVVEIPLDEPFNIDAYVPINPWDVPSHTVQIEPDDSQILDVTTSVPTTIFFDQVGEVWRLAGGGLKDATSFTVDVTATGGSVEVVSPYNRVYWVDSDIIGEFSTVPAILPGDPGDPQRNNTDYIIALLNIPFKIPDELLETAVDIVLGPYQTEVEAPVLTTDLLRIDLGEIEVEGLLGNSLDYVATEYTLKLPYLQDEISLNPEWVVGKVIRVEYVVDAYSGDVTVNVYNDESPPIATIKSSIGRYIPFRMYNATDSTITSDQGANNDTFAAYIRKSYRVVAEGDFSNFVSVEGVIGDAEGYVRAEISDLKVSATLAEKRRIIDILSSGVIINV